ncbi:hypothetical protein [Desulfogranum japonicum]|uniref:hypothetical protein n=1 Tax=Desulfogranum japonicum TaxID=231447 RepID=UPI0003FF695F|nr:hypothetical protein [Desulfogranum japonicum]
MRTKNWKLTIASIALAGCLAALTGCAKQKTYGAVKFTTEPPGAEVVNLKDDASLCTTPCVGFWEGEDGKPEYVTVEMRKTGYKEEITSFWVNTRHDTREQAEKDAQPIKADLIKRGN